MLNQTNILAAKLTSAERNALPKSSFAWVDASGVGHLPYKDKNGKVDLNHTRNALARLDQVQGMSEDERTKVKAKLQGALKNAKAADDTFMRSIGEIQASDSDLPERIMLLRSGNFNTEKYGNIPLEASDLEEMKTNFDNGVGMAGDGETGIPIDFAHQSHLNAAGWVRQLSVDTDEDGQAYLFGEKIEWSKSGKEALAGKEYKCISSDFYPKAFGEWVDPESGITAKNVIVGAGLTNRPMFTGNTPLLASEMDEDEGGVKTIVNIIANEKKEGDSMKIEEIQVKAADAITGPEQRFLQAHVAELSGDIVKKFELVASEKGDNKNTKEIKAAEVKGTEGKVQVQATELKAIVDSNKKLEASVAELQTKVQASDKQKAEEVVDDAIGKGKIVADQKDKWVNLVLASDDNKELLENLPENKLLSSKQGSSKESSNETPREEQLRVAKKIMADASADKPIDLPTALDKAVQQTEGLAERIAAENKQLAGIRG